jgi:hypothetical protein
MRLLTKAPHQVPQTIPKYNPQPIRTVLQNLTREVFSEMSTKTITCPDCGLVLRVAHDSTKSTLLYEVGAWESRCQRPDLDDPARCLIRREGARPKKQAN